MRIIAMFFGGSRRRAPSAARCFSLIIFMGILWAIGGGARAQERDKSRKQSDPEALFLDLSKVNLGTITTSDDKKKYLYTIQLEKARITRKTLRMVYENAYDLYRAGDYEGAREMTRKILAIDPDYEDAAILQRAVISLKGSTHPWLSEHKMVENKFEQGMDLYRRGRLVEAAERWDEVVKLAPNNLKARYWLTRAHRDLADAHFQRGQEFYRQRKPREALDQWYAALALDPKYPRLVGLVAKVETELRQAEAGSKLQQALDLYSRGRSDEALRSLDEVLEVAPGDARAQRLQSEIRTEVANQYVAQGRRLFGEGRYREAVEQWNKAVDYGFDPTAAETLIARARDQMKRAEAAKRRAEEEARQKEEEAAKKKQQEEEAKKAQEAAQPGGSEGGAGLPSGAAASEENKKEAVRHWQAGIVAFQENQFEKARDEWTLCKQMDPTNDDCIAGLKRIDQQLGGP